MSFLSCIVFLFYLYCLVNLALRCLLRLLLESVEEHYHISIVEDEEHTEDVTAMFGTEFKNLVAQVFDELGIDSFLCFQHINNVEHFPGFGFSQ